MKQFTLYLITLKKYCFNRLRKKHQFQQQNKIIKNNMYSSNIFILKGIQIKTNFNSSFFTKTFFDFCIFMMIGHKDKKKQLKSIYLRLKIDKTRFL